jgi:hypothetical protein
VTEPEWLYLQMRVKVEDVDALQGIDGLELARAVAPALGQTVLVTDVYLGRDDPGRLLRPLPESLTAVRVAPDGTVARVAAQEDLRLS